MKCRMIHATCGGAAFLYEREALFDGAVAQSHLATHLNGEAIPNLSPMMCDSCGHQIERFGREFLHPEEENPTCALCADPAVDDTPYCGAHRKNEDP